MTNCYIPPPYREPTGRRVLRWGLMAAGSVAVVVLGIFCMWVLAALYQGPQP